MSGRPKAAGFLIQIPPPPPHFPFPVLCNSRRINEKSLGRMQST